VTEKLVTQVFLVHGSLAKDYQAQHPHRGQGDTQKAPAMARAFYVGVSLKVRD
jgi:hypothetical protein